MISRIVLTGSALSAGTLLLLLDSTAKAGILFGIAAVLSVCLRKSSASTRHQIWLGALAGALLLPFSFHLLPQWRVLPSWMKWEEVPRLFTAESPWIDSAGEPEEAAAESFPATGGTSAAPVRYSPAPLPAIPASPQRIVRLSARWILGIWASGAALLLLPLAASMVALRWRAGRCKRLDSGPVVEAVNAVKRDLSVSRRIVVLSGGPDAMPMVWGIFRGHLLLPEAADSWQPARLRAVLLHEISHLRRHDPLWLVIAHIALALHWFNPLAWLAMKRLRIEQEIACDDGVLLHGVGPSDYASGLLSLSISRPPGMSAVTALTMARPEGLEARIAGILDESKNRRERTRAWILGCSLSALLVAVSLSMLRAGEAAEVIRGRILDRNGIVLAESSAGLTRKYPFQESASHLIGYVAESTRDTASVGKTGMELVHEDTLRLGKDVRLTLDTAVQATVETEMKSAGIARGAAVILDCTNGDLLAAASLPSFDPGDFVPGISREKLDLFQNDPDSPLVNRVVAPAGPASTFKLLTALAACHAGRSSDRFTCDGPVNFGSSRLGCWIWNARKGGHGELDLHGGIVNSCNCYFAGLSRTLGTESLVETGRMLGLGESSGSGYTNEGDGLVAKLRVEPGDPVPSEPYTAAMVAIGQAQARATPLQLAVLAAAIGNGEKVWVPRLDAEGPVRFRTDLLEEGWKPEDLATIRSAMRDAVVVEGGTSGAARSSLVSIAGVTGTASISERGKQTLVAWFIGYAPAESPRFAFAIMAEGDFSGGRTCAPVARAILEKIIPGSP